MTQPGLFITQESIAPAAIKQRHLVAAPTRRGDIYFGSDGNAFANLPVGLTGQVLTVLDGVPSWEYLLTTGLAASRPSSGTFVGQQYFATDTHVLSIWDGSTWRTTTLT